MAGNYGIPMGAMSGFIGGNQARLDDQTTMFNQQKTLQDIAQMRQNMDIAMQKLPGELEQTRLGNLDKQSVIGYRDQQTQDLKDKSGREKGAEFLQNVIRYGADAPDGFVEGEAARLGIPANHPLIAATKAARKQDREWRGDTAEQTHPQYTRQLLERVTQMDDKSIQQAHRDKAQFDRQEAALNQRERESIRRAESAREVATINAQARQEVAKLESAARAMSHMPSLNQYAAMMTQKAYEAERTGNTALAEELRTEANQAVVHLMNINAANGDAQRNAEAVKLYSVTKGKLDIRNEVNRPRGQGAQATPQPGGGNNDAAIRAALGDKYDPNMEYRIGPDGSIQAKPKSKAAPGGSGPAVGKPQAEVSGTDGGWRELNKLDPVAKAAVKYNDPRLDSFAGAVEKRYGLPPGLLLAVKNAGERSNTGQASPMGAKGVMQFIDSTRNSYPHDVNDPLASIDAAGRYFKDLLKQYNGNARAAIAAYNGGTANGSRVARGEQPISEETRNYLQRIQLYMMRRANGQ